jgi:uncharacterized membrane protein
MDKGGRPVLFLVFKWFHVLSVIVAVGANVTYGVWLSRAARSSESLIFTLTTIKFLDDRLANPNYGVALVTGLVMVVANQLWLTAPWHLVSLVLYVGLMVVGAVGYSPALREQIRLAETVGPESPAYAAASQRGTFLGIVLGMVVIVIVFLMVVKPPLW